METTGGGKGQRAVQDSFCLHMREVMVCPGCHRTSPNPAHDYDTNVFYVPVRSLMEAAGRQKQAAGADFGALLQAAGSGDLYRCSNTSSKGPKGGGGGCVLARRGEKHAGHRYLVQRPPLVFSLGLVWDNLKADSQEIQAILGLIQPAVNLAHFKLPPSCSSSSSFTSPPGDHQQQQEEGEEGYAGILRAFFAFHPQKHHYVAFFHHPASRGWICVDDSQVHALGPSHTEALGHCAEQQYQPSLLFYEVTQQKKQKDGVVRMMNGGSARK